MGERKFRAWDTVKEIFIYSINYPSMWRFFKELENRGIRHYEAEQYIGQTDKAGKDIYEGDIGRNKHLFVYEVIWEAPSFILRQLYSADPNLELTYGQEWCDIEIIGNIHTGEEEYHGKATE